MFESPQCKITLLRKLLTDPALLTFVFVSILAVCFSEFFSVASSLVLFAVWGAFLSRHLWRVDRGQDLLRLCGIPTVTVLRSGKRLTVSAAHVVVGDVILLRCGDVVPADCRLLSAADVKVRFSYPSGMGDSKETIVQSKRADTVYPYNTKTIAPHFENLVYAGSEIVHGHARAVAFATGKDTFLGELGEVLLEDKLEKDPKLLSALQPYFKFMGVLALLLLFPMGLVGLLISPESQSGMRVFLPICAWLVSVSAILPYCYSRIVIHHGVRSLFVQSSDGNGAILKSTRSIDRLSELTDLFLIGRAPLCDGQLHFESGFSGDGLLEGDMLAPLCEAFCLLEDAKKQLPDLFSPNPVREEPYLKELISESAFDYEALKLRTSRCELFGGKQERILDVESTEGQFRLRFYNGAASLFGCGEYLKKNGAKGVLDSRIRADYQAFVAEAMRLGRRLITVVKESRGCVYLIGCLSMKEASLPNVEGTIAELEQRGVRVCLFLNKKNAENCAYANEWMPDAHAITASEDVTLSNVEKNTRIFWGFSPREIAEYIRTLKKKGRVVGVITDKADCRPLFSCASVSVACETYSGASADESECVPTLRRESDVLVARASERGGGLQSVARAIDVLRVTAARVKRLFAGFFALRILQTSYVVFSLIAGIGSIPPFALVCATILMDCIFLTQTMRMSERIGRGVASVPVDIRNLSAFFRSRRLWLSTTLSAAGVIAILAILYHLDVLSLGNCYAWILFGMLFMETILLTVGDFGARLDRKATIGLLLIWIPTLMILILSALISAIGALTELGSWSVAGIAILPIVSLLGLILIPFLKRGN